MSEQPGLDRSDDTDRPEGWYPDPFGRLPFRWWDGARWTELAGSTEVGWDAVPVDRTTPRAPGMPGLGAVAVGWTVGVVSTIAVSSLVDRRRATPASLGLPALALWVPLLLACVVVSRRRGTGSLGQDFGLRVRWVDLVIGIGASIAARILIGLAMSPIPGPTRRLRDVDTSAFRQQARGPGTWLVLVLVVCVGAPVVEELFFRGLIQGRLVDRFGPVVGIGVTSALFGAAHLLGWAGPFTFAYAWAIAASGVVLGILRHTTGRLGTSIVAHMAFNAQAVLLAALLR